MDEIYKKLSEEIKRAIEKHRPKTVLLQLPAGLRRYALDLADEVNCEVFIWGGSCYGACDIPKFNVDLIIHVGHNELINKLPI